MITQVGAASFLSKRFGLRQTRACKAQEQHEQPGPRNGALRQPPACECAPSSLRVICLVLDLNAIEAFLGVHDIHGKIQLLFKTPLEYFIVCGHTLLLLLNAVPLSTVYIHWQSKISWDAGEEMQFLVITAHNTEYSPLIPTISSYFGLLSELTFHIKRSNSAHERLRHNFMHNLFTQFNIKRTVLDFVKVDSVGRLHEQPTGKQSCSPTSSPVLAGETGGAGANRGERKEKAPCAVPFGLWRARGLVAQ